MKTKRIILIGLFAAICFVGTYLKIIIPLGGTDNMIHLGTTAIFLSSIFIGKDAGLAGGIGCALFDLMSPTHVPWTIPTFFIKGFTGYISGKISFARNKNGNSILQNIIGFICGGLVSLAGYFLFNWFVFVGFKAAVVKAIGSIITTILGVLIAIPLSIALKPIINKSGIKTYE